MPDFHVDPLYDAQSTPGTPENNALLDRQNADQARQAHIDAQLANSVAPSSSQGVYPRSARQAKPRFSKWMFLTVPVGLCIALIGHVNGPHGPIPVEVQWLAGTAVAVLGSPRGRVAGILVLVLMFAAAAWLWS